MIGPSVAHYKIASMLARGGMRVVYESHDTTLGRHVALKFLPVELAQDATSPERFQREARAASALNHPGICTVYAIEQHEGQHFIAMELLEGETLAERIRRGPFEIAPLGTLGQDLELVAPSEPGRYLLKATAVTEKGSRTGSRREETVGAG